MSLIPCGPRILVEPEAPCTQSKGGIVLPENAQYEAPRGKVVALSADLRDDSRIVAGATVYYATHAVIPLSVDLPDGSTKRYYVLRVEDVLAVEV